MMRYFRERANALRGSSQWPVSAFVMTVEVTSDSLTFQWPNRAGTRNALIEWGDGTSQISTGDLGPHTYPAAGQYDIVVSGVYTAPFFNGSGDILKCVDVKQWGAVTGMTNFRSAFFACANLIGTATDGPTGVTDMSFMFYGASTFNQPIGNWDTAKVAGMRGMFSYATKFNQPIGDWVTANVYDMAYMFRSASAFNQPIGNWDTAKVTDISGMFYIATAFNQPIGDWDTSKVNNLSYMFHSASAFNQPIGDWDTSAVTNMSYMFQSASAFNQDLSGWCVTNIPVEPVGFGNPAGVNPIWGTCP